MRRLAGAAFGLALAAAPAAQSVVEDPAEPVPVAPLDTQRVAARPVPADGLEAFRAHPDFDYGTDLSEGPTWWDLFWRWFDRTFLAPLVENTSATFREWALLGLALAALAWAVARVVSAGPKGFFSRRDRAGPAASAPLLDVESLAGVDLDVLLRDALADSRRRDAVRLRYLRALQALAARGTLAWRKDKLNREYLAEVRRAAPALALPFAEATRLFEWVWYGDAPLDDAAWAGVQARLDRLDRALAGGTVPVES